MQNGDSHAGMSSYRNLLLELAVDFVIMYFVMYTMIDSTAHFHFNANNVYMTLMMVAPMALVMLVAMRSMFTQPRWNRVIAVAGVLVFAFSFWAMRTQAAVGDREFLRAMIPHHSGAILMCQQASLRDPEVIKLCGNIVESQKAEIAQMEQLLAR